MEPQPVIKRSAIPRRAWWIGFGLVALNLCLLAGCFLTRWIPTGKVIERERIRVKEGLAAIRAERVLRPIFFEPAEEGNSWELLTQGLTALEPLTEEELQAFPAFRLDEESPPPPAEEVAKVVTKVEPHLEVLKRAIRRSWVEPNYPYEESFAMRMPLVGLSIKACRILGDRAASKHEAGRAGDAAELLITGLGVGDRMAVKGGLVNELVRIVCTEILADHLKKMLADHRFGGLDLGRLERALSAFEQARPALRDCLRREDLSWAAGLVTIVDGGDSNSLLPDLGPFQRFTLRFQIAEYFEIMAGFHRDVDSAMNLPIQEGMTRLGTLVRDVVNRRNVIIALLIPQLSRAWRNYWKELQSLSLARLSVAIARHQAERGAFPKALGDLVPAYLPSIPADRFTGHPFGYVTKEETATVYSWGVDGDDDGGRALEEGMQEDPEADGDVVWTVKRGK